MGIANPVTRETHGSGTHYHLQLAKQLGDMLQAPLEVGVDFLCVAYVSSKKDSRSFTGQRLAAVRTQPFQLI